MKIDNSSFEMLDESRCLGTTLTNQNSLPEEIKGILNQGMLAIIRCRIFLFQFAIQKLKD